MVDFVGTVVTAALMVMAVNVPTTFMDIPRAAKLTLADGINLWIGMCAAVSAAGFMAITEPLPIIGPRWLPLASRSHRRNRSADGDRRRELKRHIIRMLDGLQLSEGV